MNFLSTFSLLTAATTTTGVTAPKTQSWEQYVLLIGMMAVMVFLLWFSGRKQRKQQKVMAERRKNLKNGDRVMMSCGIYGTVTNVGDNVVTILTGEGTSLVFNTAYVAVVEYDDDAEDMSQKEAQNANK